MKKAVIYYFSGTGNTMRISELYKREFEAKGISCVLISLPIIPTERPAPDYFDFVGIAYPIHAFNAPEPILKFVRGWKTCKNKTIFILKTSGEGLRINDISSLKLKSILRRKGCDTANEFHYLMPYNIIFRHSDDMAYRMFDTARKRIPVDLDDILKKRKNRPPYFPFGRAISFLFRIEQFAVRKNGRRFKADESCIRCGKCVEECPQHNIAWEENRLRFSSSCVLCMRCSFFCPTHAIHIGLFDSWRVFGPYSFTPGETSEDPHKKYCRRSYEKYFAYSRKRIETFANNRD